MLAGPSVLLLGLDSPSKHRNPGRQSVMWEAQREDLHLTSRWGNKNRGKLYIIFPIIIFNYVPVQQVEDNILNAKFNGKIFRRAHQQ